MRQAFCRRLSVLALGPAICLASYGQQTREYLKTAVVTKVDSVVTITANDPRPLAQALCAIAKRNEWLVDYEDPPYAGRDLIDVTNREWLAKNPNAHRALIPAGGEFRFAYDESAGEAAILQNMVEAYNRSENPGAFEVRDEGTDSRPWTRSHKRYAVVGVSIKDANGQSKHFVPVLDTAITLPVEERSAQETVDLIEKEISDKIGVTMHGGAFANNALIQSRVRVGGKDVPARTLLLQTLQQMDNPSLVWRLNWDATMRAYYLNLGITRSCV